MANVNSSTSTTTSAYSSHGLSGLASGLDTESMVQAMLQSTQNRIDAQNQKITKLEWKQSAYRDIITQIQSFQSKYFSFASSATNLKSTTFWNNIKVASNNAAVSVLNKSATSTTNITINSIKHLATATTQYGKSNITGDIQFEIPTDIAACFGSKDTLDIQVTLDGVQKTIELSKADCTDASSLTKNLNSSLSKYFGSGVQATLNGNTITLGSSDHVVKVNANTEEAKQLLGLKTSSVSNKISMNSSLDSLALTSPLQGNLFKFEINGETFEFDGSASVGSIVAEVNKSNAGVTMTYDSLNDRFVLTASNTGANVGVDLGNGQYGIQVKDLAGNLMSSLMGAQGASSAASVEMKSQSSTLVGAETINFVEITSDKIFKMTVNGTEKTYTVSEAENQEKLIEKLNELIQADYSDISLSLNTDNKVVLTKPEDKSYEISFAEAEDESINKMLGFTETSKNYAVLTEESKLSEIYGISGYDFTINGVAGNLTADSQVKDLIAFLNTNMSSGVAEFNNGRLIVAGGTGEFKLEDTGTGDLVKNLFGTNSVSFDNTSKLGDLVPGQDAVVVINGQEVHRNSNSFELDGVQIVLNSTYNETYDSTNPTNDVAPINITSTQNTENVVTTVKEFVTAYNEMLKKVNDLISESTKESKKYPPLTEAQKKEMTEKEIELWEEKAKKGLLANDSLLTSLRTDFRSFIYSKVKDDGIALYDIGITTNTDGTLKLDENKLSTMIETNLDDIVDLFTDSEQGISIKMDNVCTKYAKQSISNPGLLVQRAGVKNSSTENQNFISKQIDDLKSLLKRLQTQYDSRRDRYWKQFSSLETLVSNSNATSSWLSSMFTY